jgi:hypothetical protein
MHRSREVHIGIDLAWPERNLSSCTPISRTRRSWSRLSGMEPIRHTLTARLKNLKMYRDDVDQLVAIFQRDCKNVIISDNNYRYDSLDEMKQKVGPRIKNLDIRGENPGVRFSFNQTEITKIGNPPLQGVCNELRTEEITDPADGVFYKIKDFIARYERPYFIKPWAIPMTLGFIGVLWFALHNAQVNKAGEIVVIGSLPGVVISVAVLVVSLLMGQNTTNHLSLETKRNSASFFVRNREEFAKYAVTAILSGLIGAAIAHYLK